MEALTPDPRSIRPETWLGRCAVSVAYVALYLGAAKWGRDMLWIDDFGAGYSSLGHLHRLPVSVVKVDRMFTEQLGSGRAGESVVSSVVQLARAMDLRVIAEGVETERQVAQLSRLGVDAVQGFGLSRPVSAEDLASQLTAIPVTAAPH